ncbi:hypothetical protein T492DRAFT_901548 [Pavlovales sp. CCMP2436]|nr:hypothetical protein T492DRAFT_901548 [Pavlovales sp. CCMP2436]
MEDFFQPYCTLAEGASDDDEDSDQVSSGGEPERRFPCDEPGCGYRATTASHLTTHKRTHSGERPYACDEPGCSSRASEAGKITAHKRTHSGERPYACDEPGYYFFVILWVVTQPGMAEYFESHAFVFQWTRVQVGPGCGSDNNPLEGTNRTQKDAFHRVRHSLEKFGEKMRTWLGHKGRDDYGFNDKFNPAVCKR